MDFTQFANYMFNFFLHCVFKNSSTFSSINVTPFILRRWRIVCAACGIVLSGFEGVSVQQVALWCVCVCVGGCVYRNCVVVSVCGVCVVCVCVCVWVGVLCVFVSSFCGCE
jgi:hypothetical protein